MSGDDFVKKYAYNIRHNYGKEGKRQEYTPFSCIRIIMGTAPAANEYHGARRSITRPPTHAARASQTSVLRSFTFRPSQLRCLCPCSAPGCPFKHWDPEHMKVYLMKDGVRHIGAAIFCKFVASVWVPLTSASSLSHPHHFVSVP
jgi:hypothetical protein